MSRRFNYESQERRNDRKGIKGRVASKRSYSLSFYEGDVLASSEGKQRKNEMRINRVSEEENKGRDPISKASSKEFGNRKKSLHSNQYQNIHENQNPNEDYTDPATTMSHKRQSRRRTRYTRASATNEVTKSSAFDGAIQKESDKKCEQNPEEEEERIKINSKDHEQNVNESNIISINTKMNLSGLSQSKERRRNRFKRQKSAEKDDLLNRSGTRETSARSFNFK